MEQEKRSIGSSSSSCGDGQGKLNDSSEVACFGETEEALIKDNLWRVPIIAHRFKNTGVEHDDLVSIGTFGLIKAVRTFSSDKNVQMGTYVTKCVMNEILMYLRYLGRQKNRAIIVPFDDPVSIYNDGNCRTQEEDLGTDEHDGLHYVEAVAERQMLLEAVGKLEKKERAVIELRFGLGTGNDREMSQKEVGKALGLSQSYVSKIETKALKWLKVELLEAGF